MAGATARWELTLSSAWTDSDASESPAPFLSSEPAIVRDILYPVVGYGWLGALEDPAIVLGGDRRWLS